MCIHHFARYKSVGDMKRYLKKYLNSILMFLYEFVYFARLWNPTNELRKTLNLARNRKFCQNHQKSTNVGFFDNFFHKSLVLILKYTVCEFHDYRTIFDEMTIFWIRRKKNQFPPPQKKQKCLTKCLRILWLSDSFWRNDNILNSKKKKSIFFSKKKTSSWMELTVV